MLGHVDAWLDPLENAKPPSKRVAAPSNPILIQKGCNEYSLHTPPIPAHKSKRLSIGILLYLSCIKHIDIALNTRFAS